MIAILVAAVQTAAFVAPLGWTREPVDAAHATIVPRIRTVEAWVPYAPTPAKDVLYYAAGDGSGVTLDEFVAETRAALPTGIAAGDKPLTLCDGLEGRYIAFSIGAIAVEETIAVGGGVAAAARYERAVGSPENPDARRSIESLCPQAEAPASD